MFEYEYPHPAVTTDAAVFAIRDDQLQVLLICRGEEPFRGQWALPGGFVDIDEELEDCAARELREEAGISGLPLTQLATIGTVGRDPRERVITVVYWCLTASPDLPIAAGDDAADVAWFAAANLPELANDHNDIIGIALRHLDVEIFTSRMLAGFLPQTFEGGELHRLCQIILRRPCDRAMPANRLSAMGLIEPASPRPGSAVGHYRFVKAPAGA